ncbi:MAG TPA: hypothetical protein PK082_10905, partial [Phycisphaerae bacterium]|nr:hypothetical protein [Phycisphaerae bacterium]
ISDFRATAGFALTSGLRIVLLVAVLAVALLAGGCSDSLTSDRLEQGYGPPRQSLREGPKRISATGVRQLVVQPDGTIILIGAEGETRP